MNYPDAPILEVRGMLYTCKKDRWEQIERVREVCRFVQGRATLILAEVQKKPAEDYTPIKESIKALENALKAMDRIIELNLEISTLEEPAWGKK